MGILWASTAYIANPPVSYTTTFPLTENPIVEDGGWTLGGTTGLLWTNPRTVSGGCFPLMTAFDGIHFIDSVAHRSGFGANYTITGKVFNSTPSGTTGTEIELLARANITANSLQGYELDIVGEGTSSPNVNLVRLNPGKGNTGGGGTVGAGNYDVMWSANSVGTINDGDDWSYIISGNTFQIKCNGSLIQLTEVGVNAGATATSFNVQTWATNNGGSYFSTGQPGMGYWDQQGGSPQTAYGWKRWSAS